MAQVDAYIRGDATLRDAEAWDPTLRERLHKQFYAACYSRHQQVLLAARAGALTEAGAAPYFVPHSSPARPPGASVVVSGVPGAESAAAPRAVFQPRVPPGPPSQTLLAAQRLLSRPPSAQAPYISSLAGPPPAREEDEGSDGEQPDSPLSESDGEANAFTTYVPQWTSAGLSEDARGREEALQSPPHKKNKETIAGSFGEDFKIKSPSPPPSIDFSPQNSPPTSRPIPPPLLRAPPPHPVPVVEAQSLAAVPLPPPLVRAPAAERAALHGRLSAVQFEAVALATQRHATALSDGRRAAFFLGDGAGVGKGRTLAALVLDAWAAGRRRHVWVSVGPDLAVDARRDLDDVGAGHVPLHALAKLPYGALASKRLGVTQGVLFLSYATLTSVAERGASRYRQILAWCGGAEFEGLVMFDESHRAKNLTSDRGRSSQIGLRVGDLQAALPAARVVYCSATGASEPRNMAYMTRLGLWAERNKANAPAAPSSLPWRPLAVAPPPPFGSFADFLEALSSSRGAAGALALQELVAVDLKAAGAYVCRTLSFAGTEFVLAEAPLEPEAEASYAASARFWIKLRLAFADAEAALERAEGGKGDDEAHSRPRPESDQLADAGTTKRPASRGGGRSAPQSSPLWRAFWAAHQRFFRALCLSAKVSEAARLARTALAEGKCVVVGLQTTGEASTAETHARAGGQPLDDFASGPREMLLRLLRDAYPMPPDPRARSSTEGSSQFVAPRNAAQEGRREGAARRAAAGQVCYREKNESEHSFLFTSSSEGGKERKKRRRLEGREKALEKVPTSAPPIVESDTTETCASSDNSSSSFESSSDSLPTSTSTPDKLKRRRPASDSAQARAASDDEPKAPLLQTQSLRPASRSPLPQGQAGIGQPKRSKTIVDSSTSQSGSESSSSSVSSAPCSETSTSCQGCKGSDEGDSGGSSQRASSAAAPSLPSGSEYSGAEPSTSPAAVAAYEAARARRDALAAEAGALPLPPNPLDDLIERLGGSDEVAEMTGRRSRLVRDPKTGLVVLESRGARLGEQERAGEEGEEGEEGEGSEARPVEAVNVRERALFQSGRKLVAVISEAASAGISLHADARAGNQRRRVHLTMELPWAADRAIQQFGRTHRAGQVCGPQVKLLFTPLGGERRFAAAVARRLQSLGALTMGDRRAGGAARALAALDLDCPMGRAALREVYAAALVRGLPGCEGLEPLLAASGDLSESEAHLRHASNSAQPVSSAAKARAALLGMGLARVNAVKFPELSLEKALALATGPPEDSAAVPERHRADVPRFLNRLMGLPPDYQAALFGAFEAALAALRQQARAAGAMDHGVTTCRDFCVRLAAEPAVVLRGTPMDPRQPGGARGAGEGQGTGPGSAKGSGADRSPANSPSPSAAAGGAVQLASGTALSLVHLECDRGVPWEAAEQVLAAWQAHHVEPREPSRPPAVETAQKTSLSRLLELLGLPSRCAHAEGVEPLSMPPAKFEDSNVSGFYASDFGRGNQVKVLLALHSSRSPGTVTVLRPSSGLAAGGMRLERLQEHWTHIALSAKAATLWRERHAAALQPRERQPALRPRRLLLLVGAVLRGWGVVSREIAALPNKKDRRLSIVRVETTEGEPRRFIGILVPQGACKCIAEKLLELDEAVGG